MIYRPYGRGSFDDDWIRWEANNRKQKDEFEEFGDFIKKQILETVGLHKTDFENAKSEFSFLGAGWYDDFFNEHNDTHTLHCPNRVVKEKVVKDPSEKQKAKQNVKKEIGKKFVVGKRIYLRGNSIRMRKEFIVKKFVYTIKEQPVNILILKQVSGNQGMIYTLNRDDCKMLHIKFEDGLQIWPMNLNWIIKK